MKTVNNIRSLFVVALLSIITMTASAQRTAPFAGGVKLQQAGGTNPANGLTIKASNATPYTTNPILSWIEPTGNGILRITGFAGTAGDITTGAINLATGDVTGILPIANGGTGSSTQNFVDLTTNQTVNGAKTFTNAIITGGSVNGTPIGATTASTGSFTTLNSTGGTLNGSIGATTPNTGAFTTLSSSTSQTFSNLNTAGVVHNSAAGLLSTGPVALATEVSGVLPVANGGTNSSTALNNNRIMVSSGGAIVEAAALTNGQLLIGSTGAAPVASTLTAGTGVTITNGAGTITIAANANSVAKKQIALVAGQTTYALQTPPAGFTIAATSVINITIFAPAGDPFTYTATVTAITAGAPGTFDFELSGYPGTGSFALVSFFN